MENEALIGKESGSVLGPIDEGQNANDVDSHLSEDLDGGERALTRTHRVLDHQAACISGHTALNALARSVLLGFLSNGEPVDRSSFHDASVRDCVGNRVSAHGESTDVRRRQAGSSDQLIADLSDQQLTLCTHGGGASIDIEVRTCAAGECKIAETY